MLILLLYFILLKFVGRSNSEFMKINQFKENQWYEDKMVHDKYNTMKKNIREKIKDLSPKNQNKMNGTVS